MRTRCETCGAIHDIDEDRSKETLCPVCGGELRSVPGNYGLGEPRPETLKRYEDMEGQV